MPLYPDLNLPQSKILTGLWTALLSLTSTLTIVSDLKQKSDDLAIYSLVFTYVSKYYNELHATLAQICTT